MRYNIGQMFRSTKKSTLAVLREKMGITAGQMGKRLGCSRHTINSIEINRIPLGEERAQKLFHSTRVSLSWLLANNPAVPPVTSHGVAYTHALFVEYEAKKKRFYDQQRPSFRRSNAIGFCAQLFAILENANAQKKYYMATYKVDEAIKELQQEFGQDLRVYPVTDPNVVVFGPALEIFRQLMVHGQKVDEEARRTAARRAARAVMDVQKKQSSRQTGRKRKRA
jgi:transcriptional regulator with XRE-family HTH domain